MPEIRDATSWADQAQAWFRATDTVMDLGGTVEGDDIHEMIDKLEAESRKAGDIPEPRRWRIRSLRLRGAIGIWRGSGRDEISINFEDVRPRRDRHHGSERRRQDDDPGEHDAMAVDADEGRAAAAALPAARLGARAGHRR